MKLRFHRILNYSLIPVLLMFLFEWVNIESQFKDETVLETVIDVNANLTTTQKVAARAEVLREEKNMRNELWGIKTFLVLWSGVIVISLYSWNRKPNRTLPAY